MSAHGTAYPEQRRVRRRASLKRNAAAQCEKRSRRRVTARPTRRAVLLYGASLLPALLIVTGFPQYWFMALYAPSLVLLALLVDMGLACPSSKLSVSIKAPARLFVGRQDDALIALRLTTKGRLPLEMILEYGFAEDSQLLTAPRSIFGVATGDEQVIHAPLRASHRGNVRMRALWLRWSAPLGLMQIRRVEPVQAVIAIVPDVKGIHETALEFLSRDAIYGVKTQRLKGEGTEFETLGDYAPGMDSRFIDWKHSARHRKLLCKEFRQERNHSIVMGYDTGRLMTEPVDGLSKLDHAVKSGLLLSWISLYSEDLVGQYAFDARPRAFLSPGRGMTFFTQCQTLCAGLQYSDEETNFTLGLADMNTRLRRRSLIVLFTDFVDSIAAELMLESLSILARKHVIMFVTLKDSMLNGVRDAKPENFFTMAKSVLAGDFLQERAIVLEKIARMGVHVLDVPAATVSSAVVNRYLLIKQRGLLS